MTYATVRLQDLQSQMPTEWRLTLVLPQNVQTYLACWVISIFLTDLRREAPYLYAIMSALVSLASRNLVITCCRRTAPTLIVLSSGENRRRKWRTVEAQPSVQAPSCSGSSAPSVM